jgi:hypothetical protein
MIYEAAHRYKINHYVDAGGKPNTDVITLVPLINLLFDTAVGAEIGVSHARSTCTLLQNCPNIKTLYAIDSWEPHEDWLMWPPVDKPIYTITEEEQNEVKAHAYENMRVSGHEHKVVKMEMRSIDAAAKIPDGSLDFVFLDAHMNEQDVIQDLEAWYPKVKVGGLFTGHDWGCPQVVIPVLEFRKKYGIESTLSTFDNTFIWIKK